MKLLVFPMENISRYANLNLYVFFDKNVAMYTLLGTYLMQQVLERIYAVYKQ